MIPVIHANATPIFAAIKYKSKYLYTYVQGNLSCLGFFDTNCLVQHKYPVT